MQKSIYMSDDTYDIMVLSTPESILPGSVNEHKKGAGRHRYTAETNL